MPFEARRSSYSLEGVVYACRPSFRSMLDIRHLKVLKTMGLRIMQKRDIGAASLSKSNRVVCTLQLEVGRRIHRDVTMRVVTVHVTCDASRLPVSHLWGTDRTVCSNGSDLCTGSGAYLRIRCIPEHISLHCQNLTKAKSAGA